MNQPQFQVFAFFGLSRRSAKDRFVLIHGLLETCKDHQDLDPLLFLGGAGSLFVRRLGLPEQLCQKSNASVGGQKGQNILNQRMKDITQLLVVNHGFRKILLQFLEEFDLLFLENGFVTFQHLLEYLMNCIGFAERGIHLDVVEEAIQDEINFVDVVGHHFIKRVPVFTLIKFLPQQLRKGLDRDQGVLNPVNQFS